MKFYEIICEDNADGGHTRYRTLADVFSKLSLIVEAWQDKEWIYTKKRLQVEVYKWSEVAESDWAWENGVEDDYMIFNLDFPLGLDTGL